MRTSTTWAPFPWEHGKTALLPCNPHLRWARSTMPPWVLGGASPPSCFPGSRGRSQGKGTPSKCLLPGLPDSPVIKTLLPRQGALGSISGLGTRSCLPQRRSHGPTQLSTAEDNNNTETPKCLAPWISRGRKAACPPHEWTVTHRGPTCPLQGQGGYMFDMPSHLPFPGGKVQT